MKCSILRACLLGTAAIGCFVAYFEGTRPAFAAGSADPVKSSVIIGGVLTPGSQSLSPGSTAPADGRTRIRIIVTLRDSYGNALAGKTVVLQQTAGFPHGITVTGVTDTLLGMNLNDPTVTNTFGEIQFDVTSTAAGQPQFMARDTTDSVTFNSQAAILTFTAYAATPSPSPSPTVDTANSTVTVDRSSLPAGQTAHITVTVRDAHGNPLKAYFVDLKQDQGSGPTSQGQTDASGVIIFPESAPQQSASMPGSQLSGPHTFAASVKQPGTSDWALLGSVTINFTTPAAPTVDPVKSSVIIGGVLPPGSQSLSPGSTAPADGRTRIRIIVTLRDSYGNALAGKTVVLQEAGFPYIGTVTGVTDSLLGMNLNDPTLTNTFGEIQFDVTSTTAGKPQFTARDTTDSVTFNSQAVTLTFTAYPATPTPSPTSTPLPQHTLPPAAATPTPRADENGWSANALKYRGRNGQHFTYVCPTSGPPFPVGGDNFSGVYGTDTYTDDSPVCLAAVHAGLITLKGGEVTIEIRPRADSYRGSTRNGITTIDYGTCECGSYVFVGGAGGLPRLR